MANLISLGNSDIKVSKISFGGNVFGWTLNEKQSFEILDTFSETGFNFIDTADVYSNWIPGNQGGESEIIIGKWMKERGNRDKMIIATKVGMDMGNGNKGLEPAYIRKAVEDSLRRLQTDYIDLYISHQDDLSISVEDILSTFNDLVKEGKVREIGASNISAARLQESLDFTKSNSLKSYISLQPLYNLYDRAAFETEYLNLVTQEKIAVTPYYSLASGFLTGKYRHEEDLNKSPRGGGIKNTYLNERGLGILAAMDQVAKEVNAPLSEIALAWQLHKPYITTPIASGTSVAQVKSLLNAAELQLKSEHVALLDEASKF